MKRTYDLIKEFNPNMGDNQAKASVNMLWQNLPFGINLNDFYTKDPIESLNLLVNSKRRNDMAEKSIKVAEDDEEEDEDEEEVKVKGKKKIKAEDLVDPDNPFYDPIYEANKKREDMIRADLKYPEDMDVWNPNYEKEIERLNPQLKKDFVQPNTLQEDFERQVVVLVKRMITNDVADGHNKIMRGGEKRYPMGVVDGDDAHVEEKIRGSPYQYNEHIEHDPKVPFQFDPDVVIVDVQKPQRTDFTPYIEKAVKHVIQDLDKKRQMTKANMNKSFEARNDFFRSIGYKDDLTKEDFYNGNVVNEYDFLDKAEGNLDSFVKYIIQKYDFGE